MNLKGEQKCVTSVETFCKKRENTANWWYFLEIVVLTKLIKGKINQTTIITSIHEYLNL